MSNTTGLSREQNNALEVLLRNKSRFHSLLANAKCVSKNSPLPETDFIASATQPFKISKFPREKHWSWNQSNAKVSTTLEDGTVVTMKKISPRTRSTIGTVPSYKIWIFHLEKQNEADAFFLWCEKGCTNDEDQQPKGINTEIGRVYPEDISIESLSFLYQFIEHDIAVELGWKKTL